MLASLTHNMLPAIEDELRRAVAFCMRPGAEPMHSMLCYHMGWDGEGAGSQAAGKRIRPLLVLLTSASAGGDWHAALPAAAAVELVHNFSLIHDDIEDNSPLRRGRKTLWNIWGIPQAINAGDAMFTQAYLALQNLAESVSLPTTLSALRLLQETCLHLTQGQYMDISYENRSDLGVAAYWPMVSGKTAALLAACTGLGAMCAKADDDRFQAYSEFGRLLGLAFQAQDDILGIWGDAALTGKSADSDLVSGKKSLPVLYGLEQRGDFASRWEQGAIHADEVQILANQLEKEGALAYCQSAADQLTTEALENLEKAGPQGDAGVALRDLANKLLNRKS
jgi:geranylgeranyl diphosphate synthase type I